MLFYLILCNNLSNILWTENFGFDNIKNLPNINYCINDEIDTLDWGNTTFIN